MTVPRKPTTCCGLFRREGEIRCGIEPDTGFRYAECERDTGCRAGESAFWEKHMKAGCPSPQSFESRICGTPRSPCKLASAPEAEVGQ